MSVKKLSICVFCGSRDGVDPAYASAAEALGEMIAAQNWRLVYGAGDVGLMGRVARATQAAGGKTFGVIPVHLLNREVGKADLDHFVITENMHERKKVMFMNADVIVTLPGGAGSLDEFFEVLTWAQLGLHRKPIYVLNINGYWDPLNALIEHQIKAGFADESLLQLFQTVDDLKALASSLSRRMATKE